jgi:hypothetical protein
MPSGEAPARVRPASDTDTDTLLRAAGLSESEIESLRSEEVVA